MALRNELRVVIAPGTFVRFAGMGANRRPGTREMIALDQNTTTGLTKVQFNDQFGTKFQRWFPSHWIETITGRANQGGGQLGISGGFGGAVPPSPS